MEIYDPLNLDRGLCAIDGCTHLQRNHGNKVWGKHCDKHHNDPILKLERAKERALAIEATAKKKSDIKQAKKELRAVQREERMAVNLKKRALSSRKRLLKRNYGITIDEYKRMLSQQSNVCAICGLPAKDGMSLAVDHCHASNEVRGLLCSNCNLAIGLLNDDLDLLASASSYLINSRLKVAK